mgnify:CR=1 FL=1
MTDIISVITEFFGTFLTFISTFFDLIKNYISKGLGFVSTLLNIVPNFLINVLFPNMPPFFQSLFYGLFGFMMFVLLVKLIMMFTFK